MIVRPERADGVRGRRPASHRNLSPLTSPSHLSLHLLTSHFSPLTLHPSVIILLSDPFFIPFRIVSLIRYIILSKFVRAAM